MRVYTDDRIVVREEGRDLVVREVSLEDRGEWSCTVQLKQEPVSLAHRLEILVAPSISLDHSAETVSLEEGSSAKFSCSASGFPAPSVHWVRGLTGEQVARGPGLSLARVTAAMSGTYSCVATNSEGETSQELSLNVLYKPRTKFSRKTSTRDSYTSSTLLSCQVQANPRASVSVYKDSEQVSSSLVRSGSDSEADLYTLTLGGLTEADYGNYSCVARNNLGTGTDSVMITGSPDQPVITSPRAGAYTNTYKLIWTVWTPASAKILNQSILYRRIKKGLSSASPDLVTSSWYNLALISDSASYSGSGAGSGYHMMLTGLDTDAEYEVRLRAMNNHGWSQLSEPFLFSTSSQDKQELLSSSLLSSKSPNIYTLSKLLIILVPASTFF